VDIHGAGDSPYARSIRGDPVRDPVPPNSVRSFKPAPQGTAPCGLTGVSLRAGAHYAIDATLCPLYQPGPRAHFERLTARRGPEVRLRDFL
jgi:hypothetical protein